MNELFQNALQKKSQKVPPVWMMRQAGRYHQHYQKLRAKHSFMELCKEPDLASEVALGPIQDFDFDVAILFSDLLFPLEALGMGLEYTDQGPRLGYQLNSANLGQLKTIEEAVPQLAFQKTAMQLTREKLPKDKSLIGFVGGPWTLYTYAVLGKHDGSLIEAKKDFGLYRGFSDLMVPLLKKNIELQLKGGAEIVMIFDTASGELSPDLYRRHVVPDLVTLAQSFPRKLGYYSKHTNHEHLVAPLTSAPWAGMGVDHRWDLGALLKNNFSAGFLQGNFDQALLFQDFPQFGKTLSEYLQRFKELGPEKCAGWVCGLGHGVLPKTPEKNVRHFVDLVRDTLAK